MKKSFLNKFTEFTIMQRIQFNEMLKINKIVKGEFSDGIIEVVKNNLLINESIRIVNNNQGIIVYNRKMQKRYTYQYYTMSNLGYTITLEILDNNDNAEYYHFSHMDKITLK